MRFWLLLFVFALLPLAPAAAQDTFVKTFAQVSPGSQVRVLPTADQGWVVATLDSLRLYKFNSCGVMQWARKYELPLSGWNSNDLIRTPTGGFAFLTRIRITGDVYAPLIVTLDASGNIVWARTFEDPQVTQFPYTFNLDHEGNFVLNANINHVTTQAHSNMICKISPAGDVLWARQYNHGGVWGKSMVTSDNGVLSRIGSTFLKTDQHGNPQWASRFSSDTYHYFAAVEVSDGYIFTGYGNSNNRITFHKMDKQGNLLWGHRKEMSTLGMPPVLRGKPNGNFAAVFSHTIGSRAYSTVLEFDQGLNIVRQSAIANPGPGVTLQGTDIGFAPDGSTLMAGLASGSGASLFFAKLDNLYKAGCDTSLAIGVTAAPVSQQFEGLGSSAYTLQPVTQTYAMAGLPVRQIVTQCTTLPPLALTLTGDTLCTGGTGTLQANAGPLFDTYLWSTGETTPAITITQPGTYWLRATNSCRAESAADTIAVVGAAFPQPRLLADTVICSADPVVLNAFVPGAGYLWSTHDTSATLAVHQPGTYAVIISWRGCSEVFGAEVGSCEALVMPNIFTPNSDNRNDRFEPMELLGISSATLSIYNRWGRQIFRTNELENLSWNGKSGSQMFPSGLYYWHIAYTTYLNEQKEQKGMVELLRN